MSLFIHQHLGELFSCRKAVTIIVINTYLHLWDRCFFIYNFKQKEEIDHLSRKPNH